MKAKGIFGLGKTPSYTWLKSSPVQAEKGAPEAFLSGLFERMGVEAECAAVEEDEKALKIEITGKDTAVLIGSRGDTLDALQYLYGLAVNKGREDCKKIMLDAENYREKRERTLEKLAKRLANTVAKTGKPITLEPMNPGTSVGILHATLQNHPRGNGFRKEKSRTAAWSPGESGANHSVKKKQNTWWETCRVFLNSAAWPGGPDIYGRGRLPCRRKRRQDRQERRNDE